jgi:hypothetical protein
MGWKEKNNMIAHLWLRQSLSPAMETQKLFQLRAFGRTRRREKRVKARQTGDGFSPFSTLFFLIPFTRFGRFQSS